MELNIDTVGASRDLLSLAEKTKEKFSEAITQAVRLGTKRYAKVEIDLKSMAAGLLQARKDAEEKARKLEQKGLTEVERSRIQAEYHVAVARQKALERSWDREMRHWERRKKAEDEMAERLGDAYDKAGWRLVDRMSQGAKALGEGVEDAFETLGRKDFGGLLGKLAQLNQAAANKAKDAAAGRGDTKMGKTFEMLGGFFTKMGPILMAISAVAAGIAAVVKVLVDADSRAKEFNRTLLDSGVAGASLGRSFLEVEGRLRTTRDLFTNHPLYNYDWGINAKDLARITGELEGAGFAMAEYSQKVEGAATEGERLRKTTEAVLTYSKLLGVSTGEIASQFNTYMEDMGLTLGTIAERFSQIVSVARESGYGVKRFFSMITQATSGMTLYNVRIADAIDLLDRFAKAVGKERAGEVLKTITGQFKDMSPQDRIKRTKLVGEKRTRQILEQGRIVQAGEIMERLRGTAATQPELTQMMDRVFKRSGGYAGVMSSPEAFAKAIAGMTADEMAEFNTALDRYNADLSRFVVTFEDFVQMIEKGNLQGAMALVGMKDSLKLTFDAMRTLLEGKSIGEVDLTTDQGKKEMAMLAVLGYTPDQLREYRRLDRKFIENNMLLTKKAAEIAAAPADQQKAMLDAFNAEFAKDLGVALDLQDGKVVRRRATFNERGEMMLGEEVVKDTKDALIDLQKTPEPAVDEDLQLAQQIAHNTRDVTSILENVIDATLNKIYNAVVDIRNMLSFSRNKLKPEEEEARQKALERTETMISEAEEQSRSAQAELRDLRAALKKAKPEERAGIEAKIRDAERRDAEAKGRLRAAQDMRARIWKTTDPSTLKSSERSRLRTPEGWLGLSAAEQVPKLDEGSPLARAAKMAGEIAARKARERLGPRPTVEETDPETGLTRNRPMYRAEQEQIVEEARRKAEADYMLNGQKSLIDPTAQANADKIAPAIWDEYYQRRESGIAAILAGTGMDQASAMEYARAISGPIPGVDAWEALSESQRDLIRQFVGPGGLPGLRDGFISHGGTVARIDSADDILAFQRGGPVASALGGTTINNISLIGAGPRDLLQGLINAMEVGVV